MNKIGIVGAGTGALPTEVLRMAKEANVEYVGDRARKKRKINIRGVLIELLGFRV